MGGEIDGLTHSKIQLQTWSRHTNVDVLSHNLVNVVEKNEDFKLKIQDHKLLQTN